MIMLEIPFRTPTINHLYWHRGNMKIMKKEAKKLREAIIDICDKVDREEVKKLYGKELKVTIEVYEDWYNQDGTIKKKDLMNREKFLIDSIFEGLIVDDKNIFEVLFSKCQSEDKEFSIVKIEDCEGY